MTNNFVIKCSNCDKELAEITSTPCGYYKNIVVTCPFCFDRSFQVKIDGHYNVFVPDGVEIMDLEDDDTEDGKAIVYLMEAYNG